MPQRPLTADDAPALVELFQRAERAELGEPYSSAADIESMLGSDGLDLATRSMALFDGNGRLDGFAALYPAPNQYALRAQLVVGPERPVEHANLLLDLIHQWAEADRTDNTPEINAYQLPNPLAGPALTAHGWRIVHSSTELVIDLSAPPVPCTPNPRVRVRVARGETQQRIAHAILEDAVAMDWNHQRVEFEDFLRRQQARPGFDPDLWFVADLDGEPAGVLIARDPVNRSWVAWLGVAESARGNGLAKQLLLTAFDTLRARGRCTVGVNTDTHNATGSVQVYQKAGMVSQGAIDGWSRTLD